MGILIWEKRRDKPIPWRWVSSFFLFCLFVSCFQAWVDEHHNSERMVQEKLAMGEQLGFWKGQSYAKDDAIRSRDQLIFQNMQALTGTQLTANKTQQSLTNLSSKILNLTNSGPARIVSRVLTVKNDGQPATTIVVGVVIAETTKRIAGFSGKISCPQAFAMQQVQMLQGVMALGPSYRQHQGQTEVDLDFSGSPWDTQQPLVAIVSGDKLDVNKCVITQR